MAKVAGLACCRSDRGSFFGKGCWILGKEIRRESRAMGVEGENVTVGEWGAEGETGIGERRRWETGV
jgi:hypothetical protein